MVLLLLLTQHWLHFKTPKHHANDIMETTTYTYAYTTQYSEPKL